MAEPIPYPKVRHTLRTGDLLVWNSDDTTFLSSLLTRLVRVLTLSEYSHTAIALVHEGRVYAVEATIPKIRLTPLSTYRDFYCIPMGITEDPVQQAVMLQHIKTTYLDCRYSLFDCIRGYFGKTDTRNDRWQCAELCNHFYKFMGIDLGNAYTPSRLIRAVIKQRGATILHIEQG